MARPRLLVSACLAAWALMPPASLHASVDPLAPTPGAESVLAYGAVPNDTGDDTAAFQAAISAAAANRIRPGGPDGSPQGVVYVPPGTYRVCGVAPKSNVRMEFDASAVMLLGRDNCGNPSVIVLGGGVRNVTVIGVGSSTSGKPAPLGGRDISHSFTINADPAVTGVTADEKAMSVRWASYVRIENVITIQNASRTATNRNTQWTSNSPAITFYGEPGSTAGAPRLPQHVVVDNLYNASSPVSYGAVQVSACVDCSINHLFSQGGVALRLETDAEEAYYLRTGLHYYSTVDQFTANDLYGYNGRQAVTFSPHSQNNGTVTITNVVADSTYSAVRTANSGGSSLPSGSFSNLSSVTTVDTRPGTQAQIQMAGSVGWTLGPSWRAIDDAATTFRVQFADIHCGGLKSTTLCV
jgi:hypothetical protein